MPTNLTETAETDVTVAENHELRTLTSWKLPNQALFNRSAQAGAREAALTALSDAPRPGITLQEFTESGPVIVPSEVELLGHLVTLVGGGEGGESGPGGSTGGAGGESGIMVQQWYRGGAITNDYDVVIGAGGEADLPGGTTTLTGPLGFELSADGGGTTTYIDGRQAVNRQFKGGAGGVAPTSASAAGNRGAGPLSGSGGGGYGGGGGAAGFAADVGLALPGAGAPTLPKGGGGGRGYGAGGGGAAANAAYAGGKGAKGYASILTFFRGDPVFEVPPVTLTTILGAEPPVYLHADDLVEADGVAVTTWTGRTTYSGTGVSSPLANVDGYDGARKSLSIAGNPSYLTINGVAPLHTNVTTPFTWILAANVAGGSLSRAAIALGNSAGSFPFQFLHVTAGDLAEFWSNNGADEKKATGTALAENVPSIIGITYTGTHVSIIQRTSSGDAILVNNVAHAPTGSAAFDTLALGRLDRNVDFGFTPMQARCFVALPGTSVTQAKLIEALDFVETELDCPV